MTAAQVPAETQPRPARPAVVERPAQATAAPAVTAAQGRDLRNDRDLDEGSTKATRTSKNKGQAAAARPRQRGRHGSRQDRRYRRPHCIRQQARWRVAGSDAGRHAAQQPQAFVNGNINRMRSGAVIQLPDAATAQATSNKEARQIMAAQSRDFNEFRRQLAGIAPVAPVAAATRSASGQVQAHVEDSKPNTAAPDKLTLSKGSVRAWPPMKKLAQQSRRRISLPAPTSSSATWPSSARLPLPHSRPAVPQHLQPAQQLQQQRQGKRSTGNRSQ